MTNSGARTTLDSLRARGGGIEVRLDERTGLPSAIVSTPSGTAVPLAFAIELETGGQEVAGTMGGLAYRNTQRHQASRFVPGSLERSTSGPEESYVIEADAGEWRVRCRIALGAGHPRAALSVAVSPKTPGEEGVLRDLHVRADLRAADLSAWNVEAPGNALRPGVGAADVREPVAVRTAGDQLGSPGLVALHREELTLVLWPLSRSESGEVTIEPLEDGLRWHLRTELAGAVSPGEWLEHGPIYLDLVERPWSELRQEIKRWHGAMGVTTPPDQPAWARAANIFEVMVGSAPFRSGREYRPYPDLGDLIADLDRVANLGFDCLQLMPRHPYPSYNIHEPGDVQTTYGEPEEIRALVDACHERGLRVVLDILLHGVLDKASIARAIEVVHQGPHAGNLDDPCSDPYTAASTEISWARHILEFGPYWIEGSPDRHPLLDERPDWFMRDSAGAVSGVYTNALDIANEEWQDHFVGTCEALVADLGIDGFRLDAPLYNTHANWSESTRRHASYSNLGALGLLRKLRRRLRAISPDLLIHTEPSGPLVRESLDLTYSYEERWLPWSLFAEDAERDWRRVRSGRELAEWMRDFDAALPPGSVSAHFLDVHDTMWWRLPGDWWRREQIGLEATKALLAIHALRGGAYMTFVGGEEGIEDELRAAHALRRKLPEIREGEVDFDAVSIGDEAVCGVLRRLGDRAAVVAVNTSGSAVRTMGTVEIGDRLATGAASEVFDAWAGEWLPGPEAEGDTLRFGLTFAPYQPRVLLLTYPSEELLEPRPGP